MQTQPQRPNTHIKIQSKSIQESGRQQNNPIQNIEQQTINQDNKQAIKYHVGKHQATNSLDSNKKYPQKNNTINSQKIASSIADNKITSQPIDTNTEIKINKSQSKHPNINNKYKSIKTTYNYNGNANHQMKRLHRLQTENPQGHGNYAQIYGYNTNNSNKNKSVKLTMQRNSNHISTSFSKNKIQANTNSNYIFTTAKNSQDQLQILHTSTLSNPKSYNKNHPPFSTKQQLYQENIHLKNVINQLKQTVARQKIQTQMQKKKNKKYTTILNREFKKQFYYAGNNSKSVNYGPVLDYIDKGEVYEQRNNETINRIANLYNPRNSDKNSKEDSQNSQEKMYTHTQNSPNPTSLYHKNYKHYNMLTRYPNMDSAHNLSTSHDLSVMNHSNQYMVAGIKQKYQELRGQHQKVLAELTAVKGTDQMKKLEEIGIYCRALQESNKRLGIGLQIAQNKLAAFEQKGAIRDQTAYNSALLIQKNQKIQSLKNKNALIKQENKKLKQQQKQNQKLIDYLQKLIISKDTLYVKAINTTKKVNKILQRIQIELENQRKQNNSIKSSYIEQLEQINDKYRKKSEQDQKMFQQGIEERNAEIKRLQKQVSYLSTILEHWKPSGKDKFNLEQQANKINKHKKRKQSNVSNNLSIVSKDGKNQYQKHEKNIEGVNLAHTKEDHEKISQKVSLTNRISRADESLKSSKKVQKILPSNIRKRKTASIKNSQNSRKTRRVSIENLSQFPQYLRFRLIGLNILPEEAIKHLDYTPNRQQEEETIKHSTYSFVSNEEALDNEKWKKKYITLFELKSVLTHEPFKLKAQDAELLSRYIIEDECFFQNGDTNNGFVYFDLENQTQRTVAKSILKAFIQTHAVNLAGKTQKQTKKSEQNEKEWKQIISKNGARLNTALVSIAPTGVISKQRWNQLLNSINVQVNEEVKEWCIGRMLIQSQSLIKLKYRAIVPETD